MRRLALTSALSALALAASGGLMAISVHAAEAVPSAQLMTKADLKPFGGAKKPVKQTFSTDARLASDVLVNGVCQDAKGQELTFPDADGWSVGGQAKGKGYRAVVEIVRTYSSTQTQAAAWNALTSAIAGCAPTTRGVLTAGHARDYYSITQVPQTVANGLGLVEISRAVSSDKTINGDTTATYTVYRQAGTSIIETQLYLNPGKAIQPGQQAAVNDLSASLVTRWGGAPAPTSSPSPAASAAPTVSPSASASPSASR